MTGGSGEMLKGRRIIVTRPAGQSASLAGEILKRGGEPVLFPVIAIEPPESWSRCDSALNKFSTYDAIAVTSTNAVDALFERARDLQLTTDGWRSKRWYVVGDATAAALNKHGIESIAGEEATSASLARFLAKSSLRGERFLLPVGNRTRPILRETLEEHGALVDIVPVYRTIDARPDNANRVQHLLAEDAIDVVTFASPSAVRRFMEIIDRHRSFGEKRHALVAVIGPTTADAVVSEGLVPDIVATPATAEGLAIAIEQYYQKNQ